MCNIAREYKCSIEVDGARVIAERDNSVPLERERDMTVLVCLQRQARLPSCRERARAYLVSDYSSLLRASFERQSYWVMAMKAARRAGRRAAVRRSREGASDRRRNLRLQQQRRQRQVAQRPVVNTTAVERQILEDTVQVSRTTRRRPHPASIEFAYPSNKRLRKPD